MNLITPKNQIQYMVDNINDVCNKFNIHIVSYSFSNIYSNDLKFYKPNNVSFSYSNEVLSVINYNEVKKSFTLIFNTDELIKHQEMNYLTIVIYCLAIFYSEYNIINKTNSYIKTTDLFSKWGTSKKFNKSILMLFIDYTN